MGYTKKSKVIRQNLREKKQKYFMRHQSEGEAHANLSQQAATMLSQRKYAGPRIKHFQEGGRPQEKVKTEE